MATGKSRAGGKKHVTASWSPTTTMTIPFDVYIQEDVLEKLAEYARAAAPDEIGGLARVEQYGSRDVIVTDLAMLEQRATGATFNIDPEQVNKFVTSLVQDDRTDEVQSWCSIVHSHPHGMTPAMSGVDIDNITTLAGDEFFFSLIIVADPDAEVRRIAMHYAQRTPFGDWAIINELPVKVAPSSRRKKLRDEVEAEVKKIIKPRPMSRLPVMHRGGRVMHGRGFSFSPGEYLDTYGYEESLWVGEIDEDDLPNISNRSVDSWDWYDLTDEEIVVLPDIDGMDSYEQAAFMQELDNRSMLTRFCTHYLEEQDKQGYSYLARDTLERALHWMNKDYSNDADLTKLLNPADEQPKQRKGKRKRKKNSNKQTKEKQA